MEGEGGGGARRGWRGAGGCFSSRSHSPSHTGMKTDGAVVTYSCYPPRVLEKVSFFEYRILIIFGGSLTALSALLIHRFGLEKDHQFRTPTPTPGLKVWFVLSLHPLLASLPTLRATKTEITPEFPAFLCGWN